MENKLQVRNLRISFRTSNGKVQAVRDISFDLAKGETLAIVGESGSGKSVTSKAILGIQAGNAITESGEIIYDGQDLLKISEEEFHKIRGDKIAMIFQDPMSSLNPIVKIGNQLTEAMILKGKARQRESRSNFTTYLRNLNAAMIQAVDGADKAALTEKCKKFEKFEALHTKLEAAFNAAHDACVSALSDIEGLAFEMEKKSTKDATDRIKDVAKMAIASINPYVVSDRVEDLKALAKVLTRQYTAGKKKGDFAEALETIYAIRDILSVAAVKEKPNFFCMGYYLTYSGKELPEMPVDQLNAFLRQYIDKEFMLDFIANARKAVEFTANQTYANMAVALDALEKAAVFFSGEVDKKQALEQFKVLSAQVMATVDPLARSRDSLTWTFAPSVKHELEVLFAADARNVKAQRVYDREKAKYDRIVAKGKTPDYEVPAAALVDKELVKGNILRLINRLADHYRQLLALRSSRDYDAETVEAIDYLKTNASGIVERVTRRVAKARAIKLMTEVGIAEPHRRYYQYPFEFSGGMRQRIVIAIALSANPDILICDEPTTALDVTIQAQILELINVIKKERNLSVIFITHNMGVVANMADRIAVMYAGKIVEYGTSEEIFYEPKHPYTWALLSSMPDLDTNEKLDAIPGTPPNMIYPPVGDAFAARNKYAMQIDFERQPPMFQVSDTHYAATWLLHPDAPKVDPPKIVRDRIERMKAKRGSENAE